MVNFIEHICCFLLVFAYVFILYLIPASIRSLKRNHPLHIRYRIISASFITLCSVIVFCILIPNYYRLTFTDRSVWHILGFQTNNELQIIFKTLSLMTIFYSGPIICQLSLIFHRFSYKITDYGETMPRKLPYNISSLRRVVDESRFFEGIPFIVFVRNIIVAPVTEEIVFRALMVSLLYNYYWNIDKSSASLTVILVCPLYFGIAHLHHLYESVRSGQSLKSAVIGVLFQFLYTSIFGSIAVTLFMRSGSILSPIISHIFCNIQGLPDTAFLVRPGDPYQSGQLSIFYPYRYFLLAAHAGGIILFCWLLIPMTESLIVNSVYQ